MNDVIDNDLEVRYESNGDQTLLVVDGDSVGGVIAIEDDTDVDEATDLVDSIEAEVAHAVEGLRTSRTTVETAIRGD